MPLRAHVVRTVLMCAWLYLSYIVLVADLELTQRSRSLSSELQQLHRNLEVQLQESRLREARLWTASENKIYVPYEKEVCGTKMAQLKETSVVYTWVNGSDSAYQAIRKKHGGQSSVGGARDRSIDELRFSIRSLIKYVPWLEGKIYIVAPPGQRPPWLRVDQDRVIIVDQESLFRPEDQWALPTFNTNAIEPHLWKIPGLSELFLHINDDYIFGSPIEPADFFGLGCAGFRLYFEENIIHDNGHTSSQSRRHLGIWKRSVLSSRDAIENSPIAFRPLRFLQGRPAPSLEPIRQASRYYYLKHAPFVYSRAVFKKMWEMFEPKLNNTMRHKFRHGDDVITPLLHHAIASALSPIKIPDNPLQSLIGLPNDHVDHEYAGEHGDLSERDALTKSVNNTSFSMPTAKDETAFANANLSDAENFVQQSAISDLWRAEPTIGNGWLEQSGSKAGFYLCHLRDRPISCELVEGRGAELYDNILSGKVRGRTFAFNDDGYRDMKVAKTWQEFIKTFLPNSSVFEVEEAEHLFDQ